MECGLRPTGRGARAEKFREENVPTQQDRAQAPPRLPRSDGHGWRPQHHCGASRPRPQAPLRLRRASAIRRKSADGKMTTNAAADRHTTSSVRTRLRRRKDFLRASKSGARFAANLFTLQMARQADDAAMAAARFGFTVTKKVAGAVGRNRIRRRLKEALRVSEALGARPGRDYVFVARRGALTAPFAEIVTQMAEGFARLDERPAAKARRKQKDRPAAS